MLALLTNKWLAGALALLTVCAGMWIAGDVHGHHKQAAKDSAALVTAKAVAADALASNKADAATIADLKTANADFAAQAAASEARADKAAQDVANQRKASTDALAKLQTKLDEAIHATPTAAAWGRACVPAGVFSAGGVQPAADCAN